MKECPSGYTVELKKMWCTACGEETTHGVYTPIDKRYKGYKQCGPCGRRKNLSFREFLKDAYKIGDK